MLKNEFLKQLENRLVGIPKEDLNRTIDYYNEIISDKQEDGMSEEEAIDSLGSIDEIVKDILNEIPIKKLVKEKLQLNRKLKTWEIVLLSATSIIWVPIAIVMFAVILVLYVCLWSGVISLGAASISCLASSFIAIIGSIDFVTGNVCNGLFLIGTGIASLGIGVLLGILTFKFAKIMVIVCKKIILKIKSLFIRGEKNEN